MTDDDPLRAAFDNHQRAPRDIVPHVEHTLDDLRRLADGTLQVQVTHYEMSEYGVTQFTEWATVAHPIANTREEHR
ncbi:hypothetical protein BST11_15360 [Mycobacterium alsense]|uniref:Uncharacterized protein n=1 Tax=Mycobacterium alsense TaxID=324058 RepID=A0AA42BZG7_9MYCO|nr:hypothetical protein [Mycobacterium alsense]MCV7379958.1 hypothetical protein [Mycobacterium alsense]OQZ89950.1 hypothetical protein BST11_15360 [Mycobacterium alsense]